MRRIVTRPGGIFTAALLGSLLLVACGGDAPFDYVYRSPVEVDVTMAGKTYTLRQGEAPGGAFPFSYQFEPDGDVNIVVNGERYELESPYDIGAEGKKKKKTTKSGKKKTGKSSARK